MVPSSSADITRAMLGQPRRLSRNYLRRHGGNVIVNVLILFNSEMVSTLSVVFLFCLSFAYFHYYIASSKREEDYWKNSRQLCYVSGLHNFREFSHPSECLDEIM